MPVEHGIEICDATWETPVLAQVASIALDRDTMASVVAALGSSRRPVAIDRARIDRRIRELALEHAAGALGDDTYLTRLRALRQAWVAIAEASERAELMHAIYERITVAGPRIVGIRLTSAAYAHGLALALPQKAAMARPTGFEHGDATIFVRVPIAPRPW